MSKRTPRARRDDRRLDSAVAGNGSIRVGTEAVGQHVARPQPLDDGLVGRRRLVDMHHHRQAGFVRDLERDIERRDAARSAGVAADADLDADDHVAVGVRHLDRLARGHQADVVAFADHDALRKGEDAGEGDMEIDEDADSARIDDVLAEAGEIARPGAAGVDAGGDGALPPVVLGVDPERSAAPVDMRVQIDQPGRDDLARNVANGVRRSEVVADRGDLAVGEGDAGDAVDGLGRVDDPAVLENEIKCHGQFVLRAWEGGSSISVSFSQTTRPPVVVHRPRPQGFIFRSNRPRQ